MSSTTSTLLALSFVIVTAQCMFEADEKNNYLDFYHSKKKEFIDSTSEELEKRCDGITEKMEIADKIFDECVSDIDFNLTVCEMAKTFILNCTEPYRKMADTCLPENAKGLPDLVAKILYSVVEYLCTQKGENLLEFANPCLWEDVDSPELDRCAERVNDIYGIYLENMPSASEICSETKGFRSCVDTWVTKTCSNPVTKGAQLGLYDAFTAPCSNVSQDND